MLKLRLFGGKKESVPCVSTPARRTGLNTPLALPAGEGYRDARSGVGMTRRF
jgi:hypothetical protein